MSDHTDKMAEAIRQAEESRGGNLLSIAKGYFPELTASGYLKTCPGCGKKEQTFRVYKTTSGHWAWGCFRTSCNLSFDNIKADRQGDVIGLIANREGCSRDEAVDKYLDRCGVPNPRKDLPEKKGQKKKLDAAPPKPETPKELEPAEPEDEGVDLREEDPTPAAAPAAPAPGNVVSFSLQDIEPPPPPAEDEPTMWDDLYSKLSLDNADREKLKRTRGFNRESIEAAGYRSSVKENRALLAPLLDHWPHGLLLSEGIATRDKETGKLKINGQLCGWGLVKRASGSEPEEWGWTNPVLIPYRNKRGRCIGIRPHKGGLSGKSFMREHGYELGFRSSRTRVKLYTSFLFWDRPEAWKDTVVLTEGEHKAVALAQCGIPACAVPGIQMPRNDKFFEQMVEVLREAGVKKVIIAYDNEDKSHKPDPWMRYEADVYALFACHMLRGDGFYPSHCTLPDEWQIEGKADWDSALAKFKDKAQGKFEAALKKAKPYFPQLELFGTNERDRIIHCKLNRLKFEPQILVGGDEEEELAKLILKTTMPWRLEFGVRDLAKSLRESRGCYYVNVKPPKEVLFSNKRTGSTGLYEHKKLIKEEMKSVPVDDLETMAGLEAALAAVNLLIKGRVETLTDFTITCDFRVRTQNGDTERLFKFRNKHGEATDYIQVAASDCSTSVKFREKAMKVGGFYSNMGDKHVQALMQDLGTFSAWREIRELIMLGQDPDSGLWIMGDCAYAPDASLYEERKPGQGAAVLFADDQDIIWHDGVGYRIKPADMEGFQHKIPPKFFQAVGKTPSEVFTEILANPKAECITCAKIFFQLLADFIHTFGDSSGMLAIGAMLTYPMAPEILSKYHGHPGLWLDGRFQAGKSEQCRFLMQMWGYDPAYRTFVLSRTTTTVAIGRAFSQYRNIPIHADEFRSNEMDDNRMAALRAPYNRQSSSKGMYDNSNKIRSVTPETSPLVSGEGVAGDAATLSRYISVILALDKRLGDKEEQGLRYQRMCNQAPEYHRIIRYIMLNRKWFSKAAMGVMDEFYSAKDTNAAIPQDRFRISYGAAYAGLMTMIKHFQDAMRDAQTEGTLGDVGISEADTAVIGEHIRQFRIFTINFVKGAANDVMSINFVIKFWRDVVSFANIDPQSFSRFIWFKRCKIDPETGKVTPLFSEDDSEGTVRCIILRPNEVYEEYLRQSRQRGHNPELTLAGIRGECSNERYWVQAPRNGRNLSHRMPMRELKEGEKGQATNLWVLRFDRMDEALQQIFSERFEQSDDDATEKFGF